MKTPDFIYENFNAREIAKLKYLYLCFVHEASKFLLMLILFAFVGKTKEYFVALVVLLSIRNFLGGIHLRKYLSCFLFTCSFMLGAIYFAQFFYVPDIVQNVLILCSIPASFLCGPVISENHPPLSDRQMVIYRIAGCLILFFYFILFLLVKNFARRNLCFWVIVFQAAQLIVAKILQKGVCKK